MDISRMKSNLFSDINDMVNSTNLQVTSNVDRFAAPMLSEFDNNNNTKRNLSNPLMDAISRQSTRFNTIGNNDYRSTQIRRLDALRDIINDDFGDFASSIQVPLQNCLGFDSDNIDNTYNHPLKEYRGSLIEENMISCTTDTDDQLSIDEQSIK